MQNHATRVRSGTPFWRDVRFQRVFAQVVFIILLLLFFGYLIQNMIATLQRQGLALGFSFLHQTSGFDIGEYLIPYDRSSTYLRAFQIGLLNTALVSGLGILLATILGIIFGVARLSQNFLVQYLARLYIEFLRNIPLLVLLILWYTGVFLKFPRINQAITLPGPIMLTNRGIAVPWGIPTETYPSYLVILGIGLALALLAAAGLTWHGRRTGRTPLVWGWATAIFLLVAAAGWFMLPSPALSLDPPQVQGLRIAGGKQLSPEFMALLSGLAIYTSAFIADVVRAGIQSVAKGQVEAAKAIGLNGFQILRLVVFPQALRVIIPPLTSHYLNLTKNSSLAVAIGYPDLFSVSGTILNQSGRAVEVIALVMLIYLSISLLTSLFMNWYNRRIRFVER
ncbi:MAG: ABC transporter permease subunit [Anaerolineales bacterium]|nr:ABC transporter permease subunit [Anaerolineales bacterium]NUQ86277.1 ABC transporter permease subunit [Anaerolineales bacterium]